MRTPLITASELAQILDDVVLIDARPNPADFANGHLRNATYASLESDLSAAASPGHDPSRGGRHPLPTIEQWSRTLGEWRIGPDTDVVVYDDQSGANAAARLWWMLRAVGHERVSVLDGGYRAAVDGGLESTTDVTSRTSRPPYPAHAWMRPLMSVDEVQALRNDPDWVVLDVRSAERFRGETEPIDPIAGHIPGAVNLPYASNLEGILFRKPEELRADYESFLEGRPPQRLVVHCGSGVTACHTLLALEAAGLDGAALYVGSWGEWCRNDLPRAGL